MEVDTTCTVCDGERTVRYRDKNKREQTGDCYRCAGSGEEPVLPDNYGANSAGWCRKCTVIGGGHRTSCPDRWTQSA